MISPTYVASVTLSAFIAVATMQPTYVASASLSGGGGEISLLPQDYTFEDSATGTLTIDPEYLSLSVRLLPFFKGDAGDASRLTRARPPKNAGGDAGAYHIVS